MKIYETLKPKVPAITAAIGLFVLFGLMLISSLNLEKKWDAIACAVVCVVGLVGFFFTLRHNSAERRLRLVMFVSAAILGGAAAIAVWLTPGHWH